MRTLRRAILAAVLLPVLGHASYSLDHVSLNCSSSLTQSSGDALSFQCEGDLILQGLDQIGTLTSDTGINLFATGNLTLDRLSLIAPSITLQTLSGTLQVSADTHFFSGTGSQNAQPSVNLFAGPIPTIDAHRPGLIDPGAGAIVTVHRSPTLDVKTAVPEPSTTLLVMFGLVGVAGLRRKR